MLNFITNNFLGKKLSFKMLQNQQILSGKIDKLLKNTDKNVLSLYGLSSHCCLLLLEQSFTTAHIRQLHLKQDIRLLPAIRQL